MTVHNCVVNPLPAPVEPVTEESVQYWSDGEVSVTVAGDVDDLEREVTIEVADPSRWLVKCWFVDGDTITEDETLTPPQEPGVGNFKVVTGLDGIATFTIKNDVPWQGRVCAVVVGRVVMSDVVVVGA